MASSQLSVEIERLQRELEAAKVLLREDQLDEPNDAAHVHTADTTPPRATLGTAPSPRQLHQSGSERTLTERTLTERTPAQRPPVQRTPAQRTPTQRTPTQRPPTQRTPTPVKSNRSVTTPRSADGSGSRVLRTRSRQPAASPDKQRERCWGQNSKATVSIPKPDSPKSPPRAAESFGGPGAIFEKLHDEAAQRLQHTAIMEEANFTDIAPRLSRTVSVEEAAASARRMHNYAVVQRETIEMQRREKKRRDEEGLTFTPQISRPATAAAAAVGGGGEQPGRGSCATAARRLYTHAVQQQQKLERQRKEQEERGKGKSVRPCARADQLHEDAERKQEMLEDLRDKVGGPEVPCAQPGGTLHATCETLAETLEETLEETRDGHFAKKLRARQCRARARAGGAGVRVWGGGRGTTGF
jgi:hypothetical protein